MKYSKHVFLDEVEVDARLSKLKVERIVEVKKKKDAKIRRERIGVGEHRRNTAGRWIEGIKEDVTGTTTFYTVVLDVIGFQYIVTSLTSTAMGTRERYIPLVMNGGCLLLYRLLHVWVCVCVVCVRAPPRRDDALMKLSPIGGHFFFGGFFFIFILPATNDF